MELPYFFIVKQIMNYVSISAPGCLFKFPGMLLCVAEHLSYTVKVIIIGHTVR